jgi:hypothetical protein
MTDNERIRRAARALQATFAAMQCKVPPGDFETYYAEQELTFAAVMSHADADAMAPESYDPASRGGWAWWAKRILDAADEPA